MFNHRKLTQLTKRMAVAHMIGQVEQMGLTVTTADVAAWLSCSKATAKTYLDKMERDGILKKRVDTWRHLVSIHYWNLTGAATELYKLNRYKIAYKILVKEKGISDGQ